MDFIKCKSREKSVSDDIADRHIGFFPLRACKNFGQKSDPMFQNRKVTWAHTIFELRVTFLKVGERLSSQAAKALGVSPDPGKESLSAENDGDIKPWLADSGLRLEPQLLSQDADSVWAIRYAVATKMDDGDKQQIESMQAVLDGKYQLILTFEADRQELNIYNSEQDTGGRNSVLLSSVQEIEGQQFSVQIDLVARRRCIAFQTAQ